MDKNQIIAQLKIHANPKNVEGMAKFGINPQNTLGVNIPILRRMAKELGKNHALSQELWESGIHEARILAALIDDPKLATEKQMDRWAADFDSWDVCDQVCSNLFDKTSFAFQKAIQWSENKKGFVKRAGFVMMACLAVHDKKASDKEFLKFFTIIKRESTDERNFVKKAVNWALRNIGKRNFNLNRKAIEIAKEIQQMDSRSAKWVASDAIRELTSEMVQERLIARARCAKCTTCKGRRNYKVKSKNNYG